MLTITENVNLAVRFAMELALLAAVAYGAWRTVRSPRLRLVATVAAPLLVATLWATAVHGTGPAAVRLGVQVLLFAVAAVALLALHRPRLAAAFLSVVTVNAALMALWAQ